MLILWYHHVNSSTPIIMIKKSCTKNFIESIWKVMLPFSLHGLTSHSSGAAYGNDS